jgi:hypothetical protein
MCSKQNLAMVVCFVCAGVGELGDKRTKYWQRKGNQIHGGRCAWKC